MKRREVEFWTFGVRPDKFLVATQDHGMPSLKTKTRNSRDDSLLRCLLSVTFNIWHSCLKRA